MHGVTESVRETPALAAEPGIERADVRPVNAATERPLYKAREAIHPKLVHGRFRALKWFALIVLLGVYYLVPWIRWDRGIGVPDQAVLVDFTNRRFYFFFIEIWPQEVYYITGLLILAALGLFLVTALFGRVWCGYACPQTVWTDLYIAVERLVEGDRNARIRLAKQPWSVSKAVKKVSKHGLWILIAMATGGAWVFYFHDAPSLLPMIFTGEAPGSAYLFIGLLTFTTYGLAGTMREQVCTYMCPWPRIQAALVDEHALNVTYREDRGEPRGAHKKGETWDDRGDCIDCHQCVAACPMGIDIRDGSQLECIHCALCIDACNDIMGRIGRPKFLIAYDTDANMERREAGQKEVVRLIRPRTVFYAVAIVLVAGIMIFGLASRSTFEMNVLRDRNPSFVTLSDGSVRNAYQVKVVNREHTARTFVLKLVGIADISAKVIGLEGEGARFTIPLEGSEVRNIRLHATLPEAAAVQAPASQPLRFVLEDPATGEVYNNPNVFLTGGR